MPISVRGTEIVFNNNTSMVSAAPTYGTDVVFERGFFQNNVNITWAGDVAETQTITNKTTQAAFAAGKRLVVNKVTITDALTSQNASGTLSTAHTACWVLEINDNGTWKPFAASFTQYLAGNYFGVPTAVARNVHQCVVGNPKSDGTVEWTSPFATASVLSSTTGVLLTSGSVQIRLRFYNLPSADSPFESIYRSADTTFTRVPSTVSGPNGSMIWQPTTTDTRGFLGLVNPNGNTAAGTQPSYLKIQSIPRGTQASSSTQFRFALPVPQAVSCTGNINWIATARIELSIGE